MIKLHSTKVAACFLVTALCYLFPGVGQAQEESFFKFTSEPAGVSIYIDGKFVGKTTPHVADAISPGTHTVKAEHPGFVPVEVTIHFKADELVKRKFKIAKSSVKVESLRNSEVVKLVAEVGNLHVLSIPPDLPVEVGGEQLDQNTPVKVSDWPVGEVRVVIDGHGLTAVVKQGLTTKIRYDLRRNTYRQSFPDEFVLPCEQALRCCYALSVIVDYDLGWTFRHGSRDMTVDWACVESDNDGTCDPAQTVVAAALKKLSKKSGYSVPDECRTK